jgi:uncharacterized protein YndB with AHSA1/START domain
MKGSETFRVEGRGDREIVMSRVFHASRPRVFEAFTKPERVSRWLLGPDGWTMPVCEIDLRAGGRYRYVWRRGKDGMEMTSRGVFREIVPPERIVCTESFDDPWYEGESVVTTVLVERGETTLATMTMRFESQKARDGVLNSGMEAGVAASYDRLQEMLEKEMEERET